jgi:hypothetical protein
MKTLLIITALLVSSLQSHAIGGMIGGGDVQFKSVLTCATQGIDLTFPGETEVKIVKEVTYDGSFIPEAAFRVVTASPGSTHFYVTQDKELNQSADGVVYLTIINIEGTAIGHFLWNSKTQAGELLINSDVENKVELSLSSCN